MSAESKPWKEIAVNERSRRALDRIKEIFGVASLPPAFEILAASENGIQDVYMNLNRQMADGALERRAKLLIAVGVASSQGGSQAVDFFAAAALASGRSAQEVAEAVAVATTCAIFNGYYRFKHQIPEEWKAAFEAFRAPFNANAFMKAALPKAEIEAICVAVSSANQCVGCVTGHTDAARKAGMTDEQIDEVIRAGAVAFAVSRALASVSAD